MNDENVVEDDLSPERRSSRDNAGIEELKEWGREHGLARLHSVTSRLGRRAYLELKQEEQERYQPSEKRVRELLGTMPECPRTKGALQAVPDQVKQEWRERFVGDFFRWYAPGNPWADDLQRCARLAHHKASEMFRVERPETVEAARALPDWKLLRRQELQFQDLPPHAQSEIREKEGSRASGNYLEVFTIDGGQFFFEVPEAA